MSEAAMGAVRTARERILVFGRMIRFSHSVFALPFALAGLLFAAHAGGARPGIGVWLWVVVAMVGARSAAMAVNRIADAAQDAANPRTRDRAIPRGLLSRRAAWGFAAASAAVFVFATSQLNPIAFALSPLALAIVGFYSFTKRFTWATHFFLGLALGVAPVGGWVAVSGRLEAAPFVLALGVLTWVAGFDIFYALQDLDFDRRVGLRSLPARFGIEAAFWVARGCHGITVITLASLYWLLDLGPGYLVGVGVVAALLVYEHRMIRPTDLRRLDKAFFDMNALIGVVYLGASAVGVLG